MSRQPDILQRFVFDSLPIRGELVSLDETWQTILQQQNYPDAIYHLLGEMACASALLAATLKFEGSLTIQATGDGPLNLLMIECRDDFSMRGVAKYSEELVNQVPQDSKLDLLLGKGKLAVTIERSNGKLYQGIVPLEGASIAQMLENYLRQSEQLDTCLVLSACRTTAAGMLLQKLPEQKQQDFMPTESDDWNRIHQLGRTLSSDEILGLPFIEILHRLFSEDDIQLFSPAEVAFKCKCSREKVVNMLKVIEHEELNDLVKQQGTIVVTCEFCGKAYSFDEIDIAEVASLFHESNSTIKH